MEVKVDPQKSRIFQDLIDYTKLNPELALRRCNYAATELAVLWNQKKDVKSYYQDSNLYIFDLTKYQLILERQGAIQRMVQQIKNLKLATVLEFGGGIGEFSLLAAKAGLDISYHDLDGKIKDYAKWRFAKHNTNVTMASEESLHKPWDVINVMDVLEHLEDPNVIIDFIGKNAKYIFCNPEDIRYNIFFPQHISKFDLTPYFQRLDGYLWKNRHH
jgi:2-polyprenyl-3-methyl-5-hydroxy-6-metoxy-1,4-benzoquinol methylase